MSEKNKNRLRPVDYVMIVVFVIISAIIAFSYLGGTKVPKTSINEDKQLKYITLDIKDNDVDTLWVYQGIGTANIIINSYDNLNNHKKSYQVINIKNNDMYRWKIYELEKPVSRYLKITIISNNIELYEIAFADNEGNVADFNILIDNNEMENLFDEQHLIPDRPSLITDMYFDELYHARTAYEFINHYEPYEWTHPPLGKSIIALGIRIFGMNPLGWRFMDALFSVLLIPVFYYFLFRITKYSSLWASIGTGLFVIDGMRIVMGRIATLDTFAVFFILCAFLLMYIFRENFRNKEKTYKWALPLAFSGIFFGISIAVKWTGVYAGAGLFVVFMITIIQWLVDYRKNYLSKTKLLITDKNIIIKLSTIFCICCICFIVIPFAIYLLSYIPYKASMDTTDNLFKVMWNNQIQMYEYHSKLTDGHPYGSRWYIWLLNAKPVYFYKGEDLLPDNMTSKIFSFGNYAVWIIGFMAIITIIFCLIKDIFSKEKEIKSKQLRDNYIFNLVYYLAMLLPWVFISRVAFMYHYYGCVPPMIAITVMLLKDYWNKGAYKLKEGSKFRHMPIITDNGMLIRGRLLTISVILISFIVFIISYPLFTGFQVNWIIYSMF